MSNTEQNKALFIKALMLSHNNISEACKATGVGRSTYYIWLYNDPQFKKDIEEAEETLLDWIESCAKKRIEEGSDTLIWNYLKTIGKKRGFGDNDNGNTGFTINVNIPD